MFVHPSEQKDPLTTHPVKPRDHARWHQLIGMSSSEITSICQPQGIPPSQKGWG